MYGFNGHAVWRGVAAGPNKLLDELSIAMTRLSAWRGLCKLRVVSEKDVSTTFAVFFKNSISSKFEIPEEVQIFDCNLGVDMPK